MSTKSITHQTLLNNLQNLANPQKSFVLQRFFKTQMGGYGENDKFLGITVPLQRKLAKSCYQNISLAETALLLQNQFHEARLTALLILILKYEKTTNKQDKKEIVDLYLSNTKWINSWDLVDTSAYKILGNYLFWQENKNIDILQKLARSGDLWQQRIAIISTFYFIKQDHFDQALQISEILLNHPHDLIHKAVGWMLREIGNRALSVEEEFLIKHYHAMTRTTLRYAIEKFEATKRKAYLQGNLT